MATTSNTTPARATWIWYPGDFEVWYGNIFNNRRTERGAMFPPFWKQDSHWVTVEFSTSVELEEAETVVIAAEGKFNFMLDGKLQFGMPQQFVIPQGRHKLNFKVWNQVSPPSLYIEGKTIHTDSSWLATYEDKIWIDENGQAHGSGIYVPAAHWHFDNIDTPPSTWHLPCQRQDVVKEEAIAGGGKLYDFGRETFGYVRVDNLHGTIRIYYGESREEALDKEHCETLDVIHEGETTDSKAFRFVYVEQEEGASYDALWMDYEYAPQDAQQSGTFRCSDDQLNRIWEVGAYTMDLTTREFFMDGIKRDRWTWSGDAIQSYLMNYYLRFDTECVKRTIRQLRGKDPVTAHVNTIMDYTFYWFISVLHYYDYTGDKDFLREIYPKMVTLMDYVISRTNAEGFAEGKDDDWIFVDWVDFPMHKRGTLAFEQLLFIKALKAIHTCGTAIGKVSDYGTMAEKLYERCVDTFWDDTCHAFIHALEEDGKNTQVTKFPNMFDVIFGFATESKRHDILHHVMENPDIPPITTPYMRFYELEALCLLDRHDKVLEEIRSYWGGMLHEGATTFWEKYNPKETGTQHLAMYGRPYGKSLCHAWGASPIYLLGKYFLGVSPTQPGYREWEVSAHLGDLEWMEGDVPTPHGLIHVYMDRKELRVKANDCAGWIILGDQRIKAEPNCETVVTLNEG